MSGTRELFTKGRSIGFKVSFLLGVTVLIGFIVTAGVRAVDMKAQIFARFEGDVVKITELLAIQVSGGLQWKKKDAVERAYADFAADPSSNLSGVATFDAQGEAVTSFTSSEFPAYDLSGVVKIDPDALAKGENVIQTADHHIVVVAPVIAGKKRSQVGSLAVAWTTVPLQKAITKALWSEALVAGVSVVIMIGILIVLMSRIVSRPLSTMTQAMGRLAAGDLDSEIPARGRKDEMGEMAAAVQIFKDNAIEKIRLENEQQEKDRLADEEKRGMMLKMADEFETSVGQVVDQVSSASTEMEASSQSMTRTAEETTQQSAAVAAASEEASANVQTVASAAEELSSSIAEISRQVSQSSQIASNAVRQAEQTNVKVRGLADAANKIGEVVALITDIAEQTNLLALNATIEAARAGDAGKGFAVVASEVKNLANQTAKATDEIGTQISGIQTATQEAVQAIEEITKTISEIDEVASGIASAVEQQGAATQEIARNVEQAATGTQEVSSNITGVREAATETGAAAAQIRSAAGELSQQSEQLRTEVNKFLDSVRAA